MAQERPTEERPLAVVLGENLYRIRVLKVPRWSRDHLAAASGVSKEKIRQIESARDPSMPSVSTGSDIIERLARALGVEPHKLFEDSTSGRKLSGKVLPTVGLAIDNDPVTRELRSPRLPSMELAPA